MQIMWRKFRNFSIELEPLPNHSTGQGRRTPSFPYQSKEYGRSLPDQPGFYIDILNFERRKGEMKKRGSSRVFLSVLLCLAMVFSMCGITALHRKIHRMMYRH